MCYGIPASSVICVELLKQTKEPENSDPRIPRSEVIQNLSMLVGFLEWIRPQAANSELCARMSAIIKRILDKVLNPPSLPQTHTTSIPEATVLPEFDLNMMEMDEFDWLNSVDWTYGMEGINPL